MRNVFFIISILLFITLSGCIEPEIAENCIEEGTCSAITFEDAQNYFNTFLSQENDETISSVEHCNFYYEKDISECVTSRDNNIALNFEVTLHSFQVEDDENDTYKIGVIYKDDETEAFLEYHIIMFYRDSNDDIQFSLEKSSHQYDTEDYEDMAATYALDVMSDSSISIVCQHYVIENQQAQCITEVQSIRENFVSMEFIGITPQEDFYTLLYEFNNGSYDEFIAYHFEFIVTDDDQLKMARFE